MIKTENIFILGSSIILLVHAVQKNYLIQLTHINRINSLKSLLNIQHSYNWYRRNTLKTKRYYQNVQKHNHPIKIYSIHHPPKSIIFNAPEAKTRCKWTKFDNPRIVTRIFESKYRLTTSSCRTQKWINPRLDCLECYGFQEFSRFVFSRLPVLKIDDNRSSCLALWIGAPKTGLSMCIEIETRNF